MGESGLMSPSYIFVVSVAQTLTACTSGPLDYLHLPCFCEGRRNFLPSVVNITATQAGPYSKWERMHHEVRGIYSHHTFRVSLAGTPRIQKGQALPRRYHFWRSVNRLESDRELCRCYWRPWEHPKLQGSRVHPAHLPQWTCHSFDWVPIVDGSCSWGAQARKERCQKEHSWW